MDKNKIIEGAAKLVAKGAYDKAIKEYQKVLDADPKDVRVLQKMGELYVKKNDNVQAANYFTKVAEGYATDGFFLKSVALYKQVLKLNPNLFEVNLKLAELHQQLGLMSEAMAYFQLVANHYDKSGDTRSSLDTLKKMVDLDPDNVASKIKLAELYAREGMNAEATSEFNRAADYLKRNNRGDDYLRVAERLSALDPENVVLAKELASSYLQRGDQKRALAKLQVAFKADSRDVETLNLLAQAFEALGQTSKTVSVYKELARIHEERGDSARIEGIWDKIASLDAADPDLQARRAPAPSRASSAAPAAKTNPAAAAAPQASPAAVALGREQLSKLLTETDVYLKYGLHEKALDHLRKIFTVDPENIDAHEKAYAIYVASGNTAQAFDQLLNVLRLCTRAADVARAQPYLTQILSQDPEHAEVPAFLSVLQTEETQLARRAELEEEAIIVDSAEEDVLVADAPEDALAQPEDDALALATVQTGDDETLYDDSILSDAFEAEAVVEEDDEEPEAVVVEDDDEEPMLTNSAFSLEEERTYTGDSPFESSAAGASYDFSAQDDSTGDFDGSVTMNASLSGDELDAIRAAQNPPFDEALPDTDAGQTFITEEPYSPELDPPFETAAEVEPEAIVEEAEPEEEPAAEECDEATFFLDQGLLEEAREILETVTIAFPGHPRGTELMARLEAAEADAQDAPVQEEVVEEPLHVPSVEPVTEDEGERDAFDLAAELAGELGELSGDDADAAPAASSDDFQYSVDEVFAEFKKGLEKVVKPEDVDTHYDLGIAYKEMGLLEDAIGEFKVAREGCLGKKREVECLTMMGLIQGMKGDHAGAVQTFKDALASEHANPDVARALTYELATAHEALGNPGKALFHYQRVASTDAKYRDVEAMVARLSKTTQPEDDSKPAAAAVAAASAPKTRKVGYV